jgi:hypothetical protein
MKTARYTLLVISALLFAGCPAQSIFGLFSDHSRQSIPFLAGSWGDENGETMFSFTETDPGRYDAAMIEKGDTNRFIVETGMIGTRWFLDSYPEKNCDNSHSINVHIFWNVKVNGDTLRLSSLEGDRLKELSDAKQLTAAHLKQGGDILLTASTDELRAFVLSLAADPKAFPEASPLIRVR